MAIQYVLGRFAIDDSYNTIDKAADLWNRVDLTWHHNSLPALRNVSGSLVKVQAVTRSV